jgi:predicted nucleic acid-binding protein
VPNNSTGNKIFMIILDSSIWIEHLRNNQLYFPKVKKLLENKEVLAVECIFGELLQGIKNKSGKEIIHSYWTYLPKENYENIIIQAGEYSAQNKLLDHGVGLIDAIILMHSIKSNSKIWTLDKKFLRIIPEELIYKDS